MRIWKVGLVGRLVLGLAGSSILCLTPAVHGRGPGTVVQQQSETPAKKRPSEGKPPSSLKAKIVGTWRQTDIDSHWTFTDDGELDMDTMEVLTVNHYTLGGNKLKIIHDRDGTAWVVTITRLTDTVLIAVDPDGRRIELRKVQPWK